MSSLAMEICPLCAMCPLISGRWRLQVRCNCGACGPKMKTRHDAISRWNSVVGFVRELSRASVLGTETPQRPSRARPHARWLARAFGWQARAESNLYL